MTGTLFVQYTVIALAVVASLGLFMHKQFPAAVRRLRVACALPLVREGRAEWLRRVGRWIAPMPISTTTGCGGCSSCD